jgi:hypothetical protein
MPRLLVAMGHWSGIFVLGLALLVILPISCMLTAAGGGTLWIGEAIEEAYQGLLAKALSRG